jgi:rhamnose transport system ATP-binding protein
MREGLVVDILENTDLQPETLVRLAAGIVEEKAA